MTFERSDRCSRGDGKERVNTVINRHFRALGMKGLILQSTRFVDRSDQTDRSTFLESSPPLFPGLEFDPSPSPPPPCMQEIISCILAMLSLACLEPK
jgi:hypothetical protein